MNNEATNLIKALSSTATLENDRTYIVYYSIGGLTNSVIIRAESNQSAKEGIETITGGTVINVKEKY